MRINDQTSRFYIYIYIYIANLDCHDLNVSPPIILIVFALEHHNFRMLYSIFQVGCLREIRSNGEIGIRSIDAKITQTTNPIVNMTKTIGLWLMLFKVSTYCPSPLKQPS